MKNCLPFILILLFFIACSNPQLKMSNEISADEKVLLKDSSMMPDTALSARLIKKYEQYADQFQDDTLSPEYLFRAADLSAGTGKYTESIALFSRIDRYPNYRKYPTALFLKGFITETRLNDTASARKYYEIFLDKFPNHTLAGDARASIRNMGISPEELVKQFEAHLADTSVTATH